MWRLASDSALRRQLRPFHGGHGVVGATERHLRRRATTTQKQDEFRRRSAQSGACTRAQRSATAVGTSEFEAEWTNTASQAPANEPAHLPRKLFQVRDVCSSSKAVGSTHIFVMDKVFQSVYYGADTGRRQGISGGPARRRATSAGSPLAFSAAMRSSVERRKCSRRTRCAARSAVVHPSHSVGASGPSSSNRSHSCRRSRASIGSVTRELECSGSQDSREHGQPQESGGRQ
jgi:hypothetical protein